MTTSLLASQDNKTKKWTLDNSFDQSAGSLSPPQWPHEVLVKIFSSKAYAKIIHDMIPLAEENVY